MPEKSVNTFGPVRTENPKVLQLKGIKMDLKAVSMCLDIFHLLSNSAAE